MFWDRTPSGGFEPNRKGFVLCKQCPSRESCKTYGCRLFNETARTAIEKTEKQK